jgi:hypothetical protein
VVTDVVPRYVPSMALTPGLLTCWFTARLNSAARPGFQLPFKPKSAPCFLGNAEAPVAHRAGPVGQVQKLFEEVRKLPRRQQQKVVDVVAALLDQYKRKAG